MAGHLLIFSILWQICADKISCDLFRRDRPRKAAEAGFVVSDEYGFGHGYILAHYRDYFCSHAG